LNLIKNIRTSSIINLRPEIISNKKVMYCKVVDLIKIYKFDKAFVFIELLLKNFLACEPHLFPSITNLLIPMYLNNL